jgi:hypothetical protein
MKTFREFINESKITMAEVEQFLKDNNITNMDFELDGKVIKFSGYVSKTGSSFDDFYDLMRDKFGKKFNFIEWKGDTAYFEVKI